jgi:Histidine kinase-like ATPase domain
MIRASTPVASAIQEGSPSPYKEGGGASMINEPMPRFDLEANKLQTCFTATIQAEVNAIRPIVDRIMQVIRQMKCGAGKEFEIELALQEALANAVIHGCGNDPSKRVEVCVACDESPGGLDQ